MKLPLNSTWPFFYPVGISDQSVWKIGFVRVREFPKLRIPSNLHINLLSKFVISMGNRKILGSNTVEPTEEWDKLDFK